MIEEYAYKDDTEKWVPGFPSRKAAINAGLSTGKTQVVTAKVEDTCPSYFARFEAKTVLERMVSGLQEGETLGKLVNGKPAQDFFAPILAATLSIEEDDNSKYWRLRIDLMNRLQKTVEAWITENNFEFDRPKFIEYGTEELHVSGSNLNVPYL